MFVCTWIYKYIYVYIHIYIYICIHIYTYICSICVMCCLWPKCTAQTITHTQEKRSSWRAYTVMRKVWRMTHMNDAWHTWTHYDTHARFMRGCAFTSQTAMEHDPCIYVLSWQLECHDAFLCVWLDSFICAMNMAVTCVMIYSYVCDIFYVRLASFICAMNMAVTCVMIYSYACGTYLCVTRLLHMCHASYVWLDSFIYIMNSAVYSCHVQQRILIPRGCHVSRAVRHEPAGHLLLILCVVNRAVHSRHMQ